MKIDLVRFGHGKEATTGLLFIDGNFQCYTLEDQHQNKKVPGETRIPAGIYEIDLQNAGILHNRYSGKFGDKHHGMLHLKNVPEFSGIMIHIGNTDKHTSGCILVGNTVDNINIERGSVAHSGAAYITLYEIVSKAILGGESVAINIYDEVVCSTM